MVGLVSAKTGDSSEAHELNGKMPSAWLPSLPQGLGLIITFFRLCSQWLL